MTASETEPALSDSSSTGLILVVEDESAIADLIRMYLVREGFRVRAETTGDAALTAAQRLRPSVIVLDIGLPGGTVDGIEVCRRLRATGDWTPILFLTARDDEVDRVLGLELGADDYVTKPFSPRELTARVKAVVRRAAARDPGPVRRVGAVEVDLARRTVTADGQPVTLTATEFDLLAYLFGRPGKVFTREELLASVWGYPATSGTRTVDVHVAQIRAKLGTASPIRTIRGVGYTADARAGSNADV